MIGRTLKHYKIVGQLGKGGMGEVYVAEDSKLGRKVAVKILPAELARDSERRMRFEREAKAVAALNHPNIVTIYSVEQDGEIHFITMELVEGSTLTGLLGEGQGLPITKLLGYAIELTDAITGAHRKGITHRDLKPDNVMIGEDGRLKVLDFGLARITGGADGAEGSTVLPTQTVTQEGKILGTVAYMAPEQAEGKTADARSDVFALGVILYQMATGERPFTGDTSISTITSILRDKPPSITNLNRSLPRHLARIVNRCLEKDPERRYQTAQDLRNDLQGLRDELDSGDLQASDIGLAAAPARARSSWPMIAMGIVAVSAIAFAVLQFTGQRAEPAAVASAAAPQNMEISRLTATGQAREAIISADGRYVVYIVDEAGNSGMWVTQVATGSKVEILPSADIALWDPTFSPDGEFVYFIRNEDPGPPDLYRVPTLGGNARKIMEYIHGRVSFSPDGKRFVFLRNDPGTHDRMLVVSGIDGSDQRVIATSKTPDEFDDPVWSPDGSAIAVSVQTFGAAGIQASVGTVPVEGGDWTTLTDHQWFDVGEIAWLPDGAGLVINASDLLLTQLWEVSYPGGRVSRVTNDLNSYHGVSLTADGGTLATVLNESRFNLWTHSLEPDAKPVRVTSGNTDDGDRIDWAPDGRIVYNSDSGGTLALWTVDANGSNASQLTTEALNAGPSVTPDGRHVVFMSTRADTVNVWRMDLDGANPLRLTSGTVDVAPDVSPDGKWVVYLEPASGKLFRVSIDGSDPIEIREKRSSPGRVSPDGRRILTGSYYEDSGRFQVDIIPFEGGEPITTFYGGDDNGNYRWAPDGSLSYVRTEAGVANVWKRPVEGGEAVQLTHFDADLIQEHAWSPDGKQLVVSRGRTDSDIVLLKNFR